MRLCRENKEFDKIEGKGIEIRWTVGVTHQSIRYGGIRQSKK